MNFRAVFLRMMEYYNGILFLTTNRPGVLDEAVKSRVHLSLLYKPLDLQQTRTIFKMNIEKLKEREAQRGQLLGTSPLYILQDPILEFAEKHYNEGKDGLGRWNGRQIRNAFSVAASLAHFETLDNPGMQAQLRAEHFKEVHEMTRIYDEYRQSILQSTDGDRAAQEEIRADNFHLNAVLP